MIINGGIWVGKNESKKPPILILLKLSKKVDIMNIKRENETSANE